MMGTLVVKGLTEITLKQGQLGGLKHSLKKSRNHKERMLGDATAIEQLSSHERVKTVSWILCYQF